jgi:hypothetical protein
LRTTVDGSFTWRSPTVRRPAWAAQQLRNAFPEHEALAYLLHDRDSAFAEAARTMAAMNIAAIRTAPRSPWQNAYVERVIGSFRRECLDDVIAMNAAGLQRVLNTFVEYYLQRARTWPSPRMRRCRGPSCCRRPAELSRRRGSGDSTTGTIAGRPDSSSPSLPHHFPGGAALPTEIQWRRGVVNVSACLPDGRHWDDVSSPNHANCGTV